MAKVRVKIVEPADLRKEIQMYERFHGVAPEVLVRTKHPETPEVAVVLGKLKSVVYEKGGENYIHDLGKGTLLAADENGKLLIVNDKAKITKRGIVG